MDSERFDALSRSLATVGSRRGIMGLLGTLPLVGVLITVLDEERADATRRRKPQHRRDRGRAQIANQKKHKQIANQKKHKEKKPCPPCKKREKGKCTKRLPDGAACVGGTCQGGSCQTVPQPPGCTPTTCAAQGKNCGMIADGCGNQLRCGPDSCGDRYSCTDNRCLCPNGTAVCEGVCCEAGQVCQNGDGACCTAQGKDAACAGRACGPATDSCTGEVYACGTPCPPCFTCVDGACEDAGGVVCGEACCTGTGQTCGGGGTPGVCGCTPTTCTALYHDMCRNPDDCGNYGICGSFPDGCGGNLDCGNCSHPCIACQNNICVFRQGSEVCGQNTCCFNQCCANPNQGVCGLQTRCAGGDCCPLGFSCCNGTVNGSPRSTCYNIQTYCRGQGLFCCGAGNTCCLDEPCCTSDAQCTGGRRCIANGAPSSVGCCSFNF